MRQSAALQQAATVKLAAIYIRVSTVDQGERYSPGIQKEKLLAKARAEGYHVPPEYIFLDKHTGKETARPGFERLRRLVKTGAVQAVFALGVDRLARKVVDAAVVAAEFKRHGAFLDFVEMKNDDSPEGRFQFNMLASVAEYMGEKIVEKGRDGQMQLVKDNRIPGGAVIFGHDRHPTEKGRRIKNEAEAAYVLKMCQMIDAGESSYAVAAWLNGRGIRGKGTNGNPPAEWSGKTARNLLRNPALIGECHTRGAKIPVPRLVPDALFYRVQKRLGENKGTRAGRPPSESLLSRFLLDEHGHKMYPQRSGAGYRAYRCDCRTNKPPLRRLCDMPQVRAALIEKAVFSLIWETIIEPGKLLRAARAYYRHRPQQQDGVSTAGMERELATVKRAYNNIRRMCESGHCEFSEKQGELNALKRRIDSLEAELHAVAPILQLPDERAVEALARRADTSEEPVTFAKRRAILEGLEDLTVTYYRSGEFVATGRVPVGPEAQKSGASNWDRRYSADPNSIPASTWFYLKGRVA
ncbi:MAG TPA: recombinase family protein [Candidatus Acidoferrum sp.]|nr:recombinase family protein [Candidatus Acidoferrum sp.]